MGMPRRRARASQLEGRVVMVGEHLGPGRSAPEVRTNALPPGGGGRGKGTGEVVLATGGGAPGRRTSAGRRASWVRARISP